MDNILIIAIIFIVTLVLSGQYLNRYSLANYNYEPIVFSNIVWMVVPYMFLIAGFISESHSPINLGYLLSIVAIFIIGYNISKKTSLWVTVGSVIILFFSSVILVAVVSSFFSNDDDH